MAQVHTAYRMADTPSTVGGAAAGSAPDATSPTSALAESWEKKGAMSYYFAHKSTPSERVVTTVGDAPRLLETVGGGGGGGAAPSPAPTAIQKYQYADGEREVTIYVPWAEALPQEAVAATLPSATSVLLTLAPPSGEEKFALSLRGLSGAVSGVKAKAGKTRVTVTLEKAEAGAWKSLLKTGPSAADDEDF